jgi:hypothetical protein
LHLAATHSASENKGTSSETAVKHLRPPPTRTPRRPAKWSAQFCLMVSTVLRNVSRDVRCGVSARRCVWAAVLEYKRQVTSPPTDAPLRFNVGDAGVHHAGAFTLQHHSFTTLSTHHKTHTCTQTDFNSVIPKQAHVTTSYAQTASFQSLRCETHSPDTPTRSRHKKANSN